MFREMRRRKQVLEEDEVIAILEKGKSGVLALPGDGAVNREWKLLCMIEFEIEHMTGKEAIELVRAGQA